MADPRSLKVGDLVRFVTLPDEWSQPNCSVHPSTIAFMKTMVKRSWPSRVYEIDEDGYPWISARIHKRGKREHHFWMIAESTGWRVVTRRWTKTDRRAGSKKKHH
jgi:hypothetical protein